MLERWTEPRLDWVYIPENQKSLIVCYITFPLFSNKISVYKKVTTYRTSYTVLSVLSISYKKYASVKRAQLATEYAIYEQLCAFKDKCEMV